MRHLRPIVLATVAVALCAAPVAGAHDRHGGHSGAVITPTTGKLLGEAWAQLYALPLSKNPIEGNGDPCLKVGRDVTVALGGARCTIRYGTALQLGSSGAWSNAERPYPQTEAAQRAEALASSQLLTKLTVTVDHDRPVDLLRRRFELFSPQRTVRLPEDNILDGADPEAPEVPAQRITLTAHGYMALVRNLRPGRHTLELAGVYADESFTVPFEEITVVRR